MRPERAFARSVALGWLLLSAAVVRGQSFTDCDANGVVDAEDIATGGAIDCDDNGVPDPCDLAPRTILGPGVDLTGVGGASSVAAGDFDGLAGRDLAVVASSTDEVVVFQGAGDGTFTEVIRLEAGDDPIALTVADLNNDGLDDIAVVDTGSDNAWVLLNIGLDGDMRPTFAAAQPFAVGADPTAIIAAELDGAGLVDLAITNGTDATVSVLLNDGEGTFTPGGQFDVGDGPASLAAGLLDVDVLNDLIVVNEAGDNVSVLLSGGEQPAGTQVPFSAPAAVIVADFDGDGDDDAAVLNAGSGVLNFLLNTGTGTLEPGSSVNLPAGSRALATADFDGDTRPDLAVGGTGTGALYLVLNRGSGDFAVSEPIAVQQTPRSLATADFNGDGRPDVASAHFTAGSVSVRFASTLPAAAGDSDGDGTLDACEPADTPPTDTPPADGPPTDNPSTDPPPAGCGAGACGMGAPGMMPFMLLGMVGLKRRTARRRLTW